MPTKGSTEARVQSCSQVAEDTTIIRKSSGIVLHRTREMRRLAAAARRSFEQFKAATRGGRRRGYITCSVNGKSSQTFKKRLSGNHQDSNRTVRWKCGLCKDNLATKQMEQEIDVVYDIPEVSVLACGHVYHSTCFMHVIPSFHLDSSDPPCFLCEKGSLSCLKCSL